MLLKQLEEGFAIVQILEFKLPSRYVKLVRYKGSGGLFGRKGCLGEKRQLPLRIDERETACPRQDAVPNEYLRGTWHPCQVVSTVAAGLQPYSSSEHSPLGRVLGLVTHSVKRDLIFIGFT